MRKLELSDSLMTGHAVIDAEHDKIVSLINACLGIIESDENNDKEISDALLQLTHEIRRHFKREEKIMEGLGYKNLEKHKEHHDRTLNDFDTIFDILSNGVLPIEWVIHTIIHSFLSDVVVPDFSVKNYLLEIGYNG